MAPRQTELYEELGVSPQATTQEISKAFKELAREYHPDKKKGNEEKFKKIKAAYEVLKDDKKRKEYDTGKKDEPQWPGFHHTPTPRKAQAMVYNLGVTLEQFYNGKTRKLRATRDVLCGSCKGSGATRPDAVESCVTCHGRGICFTVRELGPGMMQQVQMQCRECGGEGEIIKPKDRCKSCKGKKVKKEKLDLEVFIDKGMKVGHKISFPGKGHQAPGMEAGDIVIVLEEKEDPASTAFTRKGDDLIYQKDLLLSEALLGYRFPIKQLDGRTLVIESIPNDIVKPGDIRVIEGEGFPKHKNPFLKGNLYIKFKLVFPSSDDLKSEEVQKGLADVLPPKPDHKIEELEETEEFVARAFNEKDVIGKMENQGRDATWEGEEEDQEGLQGCVHQ
jgi:DnaJ-class molecular chaperone